jgi:hypothetical protein
MVLIWWVTDIYHSIHVPLDFGVLKTDNVQINGINRYMVAAYSIRYIASMDAVFAFVYDIMTFICFCWL